MASIKRKMKSNGRLKDEKDTMFDKDYIMKQTNINRLKTNKKTFRTFATKINRMPAA